MRKYIIFIIFVSPIVTILLNKKETDMVNFRDFDENKMNMVMFDEMNVYVKQLHNGDSLYLSTIVQNDIMTANHEYIAENKDKLSLDHLHNPKWSEREWNDLPDTIKIKITEKMQGSHFLIDNPIFTYTEILGSIEFEKSNTKYTYQELAIELLKYWNDSPSHAMYMNANYQNKVINGVTTFYDKKRRTVYVSFVYIS